MSRLSFRDLPSDLVRSIAQQFLADRDAIALGQTSRTQFENLKSYRIKKDVSWRLDEVTVMSDVLSINGVCRGWMADSGIKNRIGSITSLHLHGVAGRASGEDYPNTPLTSFRFLPSSLKKLWISKGYWIGPMPSFAHLAKLESIEFEGAVPMCVTQPQENWPDSLRSFRMGYEYGFESPTPEEVRIPKNLTFLHLPQNVFWAKPYATTPNLIPWPEGLLTLEYTSMQHPIIGWKLPLGLTELNLGLSFDRPVVGWEPPSSLRKLTLSYCFNQSLRDFVWPPHLDTLIFGAIWKQPIAGTVFPATLTYLEFGSSYDQSCRDLVLPAGLQTLKFGYSFNQPVHDLSLPDTLTSLSLGSLFDQPIQQLRLPAGLKSLALSSRFDHTLDGVELPAGLEVFLIDTQWIHFSHFESLMRFQFHPTTKRLALPDPVWFVDLDYDLQAKYKSFISRLEREGRMVEKVQLNVKPLDPRRRSDAPSPYNYSWTEGDGN